MIRHIVLFRFKANVTQADRDILLSLLRALPSKIPELQSFEAGYDLVRAARSFDLGLASSFYNLAALDVYAKHKHHLPVVELAKELCEQVVAVDYEF